jgi:hypothetical protein
VPVIASVTGEVDEASGSAWICSESVVNFAVTWAVLSSLRTIERLLSASSASASRASVDGVSVVVSTVVSILGSAVVALSVKFGFGDLVVFAHSFCGRLMAILLRKSRVLGASEASTGTPSCR